MSRDVKVPEWPFQLIGCIMRSKGISCCRQQRKSWSSGREQRLSCARKPLAVQALDGLQMFLLLSLSCFWYRPTVLIPYLSPECQLYSPKRLLLYSTPYAK